MASVSKKIEFTPPNFTEEWNEAKRYPEFKEMGKSAFIKFAKKNGKQIKFSSIKNKGLSNYNPKFKNLEEPKKDRFFKAFEKGVIEMSVFIKWNDSQHELMAGNTRVSGLNMVGIDPPIWCIDMKSLGNEY